MHRKVTIVFALMFFLFACEKEENKLSFELGNKKAFIFNQLYYSSDQTIAFAIDTINDSRCPRGAACIWQGEARVNLLFEKPVVGSILLSTYDKLKDTISNFEVQLIDVVPYPEIGKEFELKDYLVTLKFVSL
jgi:hypothetical protein